MPVSSIVTISGQPVFALIEQAASGLRLRVMAREWANLGLAEGQTVRVAWAGRFDSTLLIVMVADTEPGKTWVHFTQPIVARR